MKDETNKELPKPADNYVLHLTPVPGNWLAPAEQRLKGALKTLLRRFGLRAVRLTPVMPESERDEKPSE